MREKTLGLLGLMRRANAILVGEENTGQTVKAGKAKLLLLASDASDNARRRAENFAAGRSVIRVELPFSKEELASVTGVSGGSMAAVTDLGFANALAGRLRDLDPERYGSLAEETEKRLQRQTLRKSNKNKSIGKRRTNHEHGEI